MQNRKRLREVARLSVDFTDNSGSILRALDEAANRALKRIGMKAEGYAKKLAPVGTVDSVGGWAQKNSKGKRVYRGGTLRRSIAHRVDGDSVSIGSNVEYAPYVELGTGPHFKPPPEWEAFDAPKGKGVGHAYVKPRPFIRPAVEDHADEYRRIMEKVLKDQG